LDSKYKSLSLAYLVNHLLDENQEGKDSHGHMDLVHLEIDILHIGDPFSEYTQKRETERMLRNC
jgi:hypothetical protein